MGSLVLVSLKDWSAVLRALFSYVHACISAPSNKSKRDSPAYELDGCGQDLEDMDSYP